jgi:hypothetical protein
MTPDALAATPPGRWARAGSALLHEFRAVIAPTLFFFVGFNLILFTKRLMLSQYLIQFTGFAIATTGALIVGKVVLVAEKMPLLRRFDRAPLVYPILFKTVVYAMLVFIARLLEALVHFLFEGGAFGHGRFVEDLLGRFSWNRFIATQLWIFVLFLLYVTASELNALFGDGELFRIFFVWHSTALQATRRARIRLLARLSRLTEAHTLDELADSGSAPHRELVTILRSLGRVGAEEAGRRPLGREARAFSAPGTRAAFPAAAGDSGPSASSSRPTNAGR